jgi:conjugative relaxase-like TrwC/TraI family protein
MLSIGKLAAGQEHYYLGAVASGVEDYYLGSGEAPGEWFGDGGDLLALTGEVDGEPLTAVLGGRHPSVDRSLIAVRRPDRVPGYDLCFSAPKGVSLLHALGDPQLRATIREAHDTAVRQALRYLEREAGEVRRGRDGYLRLGGGGFVAALFRHRSSRAGDPQLHTHTLVANMTRGADGRWSALDGRQLYLQAKTAGCLYQAVLRHELRHLGLEWTIRDNGLSELAGVPETVLRAFSRRRVEIEGRMHELGVHTKTGAEIAHLDTRKAKEYGVDPESILAEWHARADELGFDADARQALLGVRAALDGLDPADATRAAAHMLGETGLTERLSHFTRKEVIQAWCRAMPDGADVATIEALADRLLAIDAVAPLDREPVPTAPHGGGAERSARRYSTVELLDLETDLLARATAGRGVGTATVADQARDGALDRHAHLSDEQQSMVHRLLSSGDAVEVVVGKAGTGKTTALAAAHDAWQTAGVPVTGAAVAARAALALHHETGIPTCTVAQLLYRISAGPPPIRPGGVLVVDVAGMLGTRDLARLVTATQAAGAKLVLVGDPRQLPELTAGGAFRALARQLDAAELHDNRRQSAPWERDALDDLRDRDPTRAIAAYGDRGRITASDTASDARAALAESWWAAATGASPPGQGSGQGFGQGAGQGGPARPPDPDVVMLAIRRADVAELNLRARLAMRAAGLLGPTEVVAAAGPYAERRFATGDLVMARRNDYRLGLINGSRGAVTAVDPAAGTVTVRFGTDPPLTLPRDYLDTGGLDHGYALTVHQAQGLTATQAFVTAGDELYREAGYVALSRARDGTRLYVAATPRPAAYDEDCHGVHREEPREPLDALRQALTRSRAQQLATDIDL